MKPLRLVSYNVHKGMSPLNTRLRVDGIAHALYRLAPDILLLQEVEGENLRKKVRFNEHPQQAQYTFFGEYLSLTPSYGKNAVYKNRHHGNAVLSRFTLDPKHNLNITVNRLEQRGVLHCEVFPPGWPSPLTVLCAHLNLLEHDRKKQYRAIEEYIGDVLPSDMPLILGGDFNDWRHQSAKKLADKLHLREVFAACGQPLPKTFPATLPVLSLDRLFVRHIRVCTAQVHKNSVWQHLSDHLPISATILPDLR